ncbi:Subtilase family protein [Azospirillum lipoferum]|nr:Subtilase family protein [Azospirillum lipoferum]
MPKAAASHEGDQYGDHRHGDDRSADGAEWPEDTPDATIRAIVYLAGDRLPDALERYACVRITDRICVVELPSADLWQLTDLPEVQFIEAPRAVSPQLDSSVRFVKGTKPTHGASASSLTGKNTIIGVIDWGFDFTSRDFCRLDSGGKECSRILFLWDQTLSPQAGEHAPAGHGVGVEYDQAAISKAVNGANPFTSVRHRPESGSHGTHVLGIAAGNGRQTCPSHPAGTYVGMAPDADLILVHPKRINGETITDSTYLVEAISYIFKKAAGLKRPCVINLSLGQNGGSHDGESAVEQTIDDYLTGHRGRAVVAAAGNARDLGTHASGIMPGPGSTRLVKWKIANGGTSIMSQTGKLVRLHPHRMEIWHSSRDVFKVRLHGPNGFATNWVDPMDPNTAHSGTSKNFKTDINAVRFTDRNGDAQIAITVETTHLATASGYDDWAVELCSVAVADGRYHAWIETAADVPWAQSVFTSGDTDERCTLTTPGTSRRVIAVGNYDHRKQIVASSSSQGPTRDGRSKPDLAAPGTAIHSSNAGTPPARIAMTGTSMSAPHVTGAVALMLEADPKLRSSVIPKMLMASATPLPKANPELVGAGILNVDALLKLI